MDVLGVVFNDVVIIELNDFVDFVDCFAVSTIDVFFTVDIADIIWLLNISSSIVVKPSSVENALVVIRVEMRL